MRRVALPTAFLLLLGASPALGAGEKVKVDNFDFRPKTVRIDKGDKVKWKQVKGRHTVTDKGGRFDHVFSSGKDSFSHKYNREGTFKYICRFHKQQGQKGKVVVG
jgi:plastocyanin